MAQPENPSNIEETVTKEIEKYVSERLKVAKIFVYGFISFLVLLVGWSLIDKADLIRSIHDKVFPKNTEDVLITAYSGTFVLKASPETQGKYSSAYLTFYSRPEEKVKYYLNVTHQFYESEALQREFYLELDKNKLYPNAIRSHKGGFRNLGINNNTDPDNEVDIHQMVFRLNQGQGNWLKLKDEITVTCIILVYGKQ